MPDVVVTSWFGLAAPKGTPAEAVNALSAALTRAMQDKELLARMAQDGAVGRSLQPAEFAEFIRQDNERWGRIVRAAKYQPD